MCHNVPAEELAEAVRALSASNLKEAGGRARRDLGRRRRGAHLAPKTARRRATVKARLSLRLKASVEAQSEPGAEALE
jgi:hypothetical protein